MKSLLYGQLRELARKILEAPEGEMSSLQNDARVLYEKLTVLRYTEGLVEELKSSINTPDVVPEDNTDDPGEFSAWETEGNTAPETDEHGAADDIRTDENDGIQNADAENEEEEIIPGLQEEGSLPHGIGEDNADPATENFTAGESMAQDFCEDVEPDVSPEQPEDIGKDIRKEQKLRKISQKEQYDELQQSLFDQDIFSKEIIGFDPDEDLFEINDEPSGNIKGSAVTQETDCTEESITDMPSDAVKETHAADEEKEAKEEDLTVNAVETVERFFAFEVVSADIEVDAAIHAESDDTEQQQDGGIIESHYTGTYDQTEQREYGLPQEAETGIEDTESGETHAHSDEKPDNVAYADGGIPTEEILSGKDDIPEEETADEASDDEDMPSSGHDNEPDAILTDDDMSRQATEERAHTVNDTLVSEHPRQSLNEILASKNVSIGLNDRIAFINNLFDGDTEAFEASVKYIFSLSDIDVANEYILEILKPSYNNWFEKEKYERRFVSLILQHFFKK